MTKTGLQAYSQYLKGNKSALNELVRIYSDALTRYAYCYLNDSSAAEDIMEETFATLIVKRKLFQSEEHFHAYLYKVARNKSIDYLRRRRRETPLSLFEEEPDFGNISGMADLVAKDNTEEFILEQERSRTIALCMKQLPPHYREVLYLNYFEGFRIEEVCRIMKKNKKQVYNLLSRAKNALRDIFLKEGITHEDL